jgi:hypothetical protein
VRNRKTNGRPGTEYEPRETNDSTVSGGAPGRNSIPVRLKAQMKTYRCLWCVSTENHYILYFAVDCRIRLRNSGQLPVESSGKAAFARVWGPKPPKNCAT